MEQGSDMEENSGRSNSEEDRDMEVEVHTGMAARFEEGLTTLEDDYEDSLYEDSDDDLYEPSCHKRKSPSLVMNLVMLTRTICIS